MGSVDVCLAQVELAAVSEVLSDRSKDRLKHSCLDPLLKPSVARLVRRISRRHVCPWGTGAQDPENSLQHSSWVNPRAAAVLPRRSELRLRDMWQHGHPLRVGDIHFYVRSHPDRRGNFLQSPDDPSASANVVVVVVVVVEVDVDVCVEGVVPR